MNTSIDEDGMLQLHGDIVEGALEAFRETRYIEAYSLLHAYLDHLMIVIYRGKELLKGVDPDKVWSDRKADSFRTLPLIKHLETEGIINDREAAKLREFNKERDIVVHRLVIYSKEIIVFRKSDKRKTGLTLKQVTTGFKLGVSMARMLEGKEDAQAKKFKPRGATQPR